MSNDIIRAAIETRLKGWADAQTPKVPIAYEGLTFTPQAGQRHLRGFLMPAKTANPSQGGKHKHYSGVYQVSIYVEDGKGTTAASTMVNAVEALFPCGATLQQAGLNVQIDATPSAAQGRADGNGFWMTPVTISYHANVFT